MGLLTDTDQTIVDLAGRGSAYAHRDAFEQAVVGTTGLSVTRFWQRVNMLLDNPAAWATGRSRWLGWPVSGRLCSDREQPVRG